MKISDTEIKKFAKSEEDGNLLKDFAKSHPDTFKQLHENIGMSLADIHKAGKAGDIADYMSKGDDNGNGDDNDNGDDNGNGNGKEHMKEVVEMDKAICKMEEELKKMKAKRKEHFGKSKEMKKSKKKKMRKAIDNDILKSFTEKNDKLEQENSLLQKSISELTTVVESMKVKIDTLDEQPIQKGVTSPQFLSKGGIETTENGEIAISVSRNPNKVIDILQDFAKSNAEDADLHKSIEDDLVNFGLANQVPSEVVCKALLREKKIRLTQ